MLRGRVELLASGLAALLAVVDVVGGGVGLLYLAPAILLAALLIRGRYPGERVLARVRRARTVRARRRALRARRPRPPRRTTPRGGRLLAARLAGRGPPIAG